MGNESKFLEEAARRDRIAGLVKLLIWVLYNSEGVLEMRFDMF